MRVRLVYREQGSQGQPLFENVDCDALEFLPLSESTSIVGCDNKTVLFVNPLEVASVKVDGAEVTRPSQVQP